MYSSAHLGELAQLLPHFAEELDRKAD